MPTPIKIVTWFNDTYDADVGDVWELVKSAVMEGNSVVLIEQLDWMSQYSRGEHAVIVVYQAAGDPTIEDIAVALKVAWDADQEEKKRICKYCGKEFVPTLDCQDFCNDPKCHKNRVIASGAP
jgi:hypothetical protein